MIETKKNEMDIASEGKKIVNIAELNKQRRIFKKEKDISERK